MSLHAWLEYNFKRRIPPPTDVVEPDGIEVLEGEAAEISHRFYFERVEREEVDRAFELLP